MWASRAPTSCLAQRWGCAVQKDVGVGLGRAWELRGLPTARTAPCPLQIPEGRSLSGGRKLTSYGQHPTGALGQSQRPDPQLSLTTTLTFCDPLPLPPGS